jgi:hypothetical protein
MVSILPIASGIADYSGVAASDNHMDNQQMTASQKVQLLRLQQLHLLLSYEVAGEPGQKTQT